MEQENKQENSLKKSIAILAEMTKKDMQRLYNIEAIHPCRKTPVPHPV
jgi:hypothetical protein